MTTPLNTETKTVNQLFDDKYLHPISDNLFICNTTEITFPIADEIPGGPILFHYTARCEAEANLLLESFRKHFCELEDNLANEAQQPLLATIQRQANTNIKHQQNNEAYRNTIKDLVDRLNALNQRHNTLRRQHTRQRNLARKYRAQLKALSQPTTQK